MTLTINRVIEGPVHVLEIPSKHWPPHEVIDNDQLWLLEVELENQKVKQDFTMTIKDFDLAYGIDKHFRNGGSPIEVREDYTLWSDDELLWDGE
jgi:hypothetical protein